MSDQLYIKVMRGKSTRYEPYQPPEVEPTVYDLTDAQYLTIAGSLAVTLLMLMERFIPEHKRNHKKIRKVRESVHDLYAGSGQPIDDEIAAWIMSCWDRAMMLAQSGEDYP